MANKERTQHNSEEGRSQGNNGQKGNTGNSHQTADMGKTSGDQRKEGGVQQAAERRDDRNGSTGGAQRSGR